jgi:hypothetical protein
MTVSQSPARRDPGAARLRLRQICLVASELDPIVEELRAIFGLEVCYVDPGVARFGLRNTLLPIGDQFLEVVCPTRSGTAAGRYLKRRGGDGGYMVITQCAREAQREHRRRAQESEVRIAFEFETAGYSCMQLHPRDTGGCFFEIDWSEGDDVCDGPWQPAGPDWQQARRLDVIRAIRAAELQSPDPKHLAQRWSDLAAIPIEMGEDGNPMLRLANAALRFVPVRDARGEGLAGLDIEVVDRARLVVAAAARGRAVVDDRLEIGGTFFRLVDATLDAALDATVDATEGDEA